MVLSAIGRRELLEALRGRYSEPTRAEKTRVLDEFVTVTGYHRQHAVRLLTNMRVEPREHTAFTVGTIGRTSVA